jgi:hypothetical protein
MSAASQSILRTPRSAACALVEPKPTTPRTRAEEMIPERDFLKYIFISIRLVD